MARKQAGFTNAEQIAVELGVGVRTVQRWETGQSEPSVAKLRELAALTGKPLAYFLNEAAAFAGVVASSNQPPLSVGHTERREP